MTVTTTINAFKMKSDNAIFRSKRKLVGAPFCAFAPLPGSSIAKKAYTTPPPRRTIDLMESDFQAKNNKRHPSDGCDDRDDIRVPTISSTNRQRNRRNSKIQTTFKLPASIPDLMTISQISHSCLDQHELEVDYLRICFYLRVKFN